MTEPAVEKLRLSSPGDLVEAVPYLLGFHPTDSLVAVALRGPRRRVVFTMRLDLPATGNRAGDSADFTEIAQGVTAYLVRARAEQAVLVTYGSAAVPYEGLPHQELIGATIDALAGERIEVVDALHVGSGRWWSHLCANPACCPPEGTPLAARSSSLVAATATFAGMVALPTREALEATLEPVTFLTAEGMRQALARAAADIASRCADGTGVHAVQAESLALITAATESGAVLSDDEVARLIVGLHDIAVRDECCAWATTDRAGAGRRLWTALARRSIPPWNSVPLFLVGWFAYLEGDATLAAIAVDRCLGSDPTYSFGLLLREALRRATDPAVFRGECAPPRRRR
ncbi:MAG: DUF4192 domain-containing protein [Actinomycetota bacterium]|nr:DUF4192 domain-containing protein [Actinomycetota bacterium]